MSDEQQEKTRRSRKTDFDRQIDRAYGELFDGVGDAECPECGRHYRVEADASFKCREDGCDGRVRSATMSLL